MPDIISLPATGRSFLEFRFLHASQVENFVEAAFRHHGDSALLTDFLSNVRQLSSDEKFQTGLNIGSLCSGWGVAEMVQDALNTRLQPAIDARQAVQALAVKLSTFECFCFGCACGTVCSSSFLLCILPTLCS